MNNGNKFQSNGRFFSISIYATVTVAICTLLAKWIWNWESTSEFISGLLSSLSPFFTGLLIAYIMGNIMSRIDKHFLTKVMKIKSASLRKFLSMLLAYVLVIAFIVAVLFGIIPSLLDSMSNLTESINLLYKNLVKYVDDISKKYDNEMMDYIRTLVVDNSSAYFEEFGEWLKGFAPKLADFSVSAIKGVFNFVVAIIVSMYMLIDKKVLTSNLHRFVYAVTNKKRANYVWSLIMRANDIFSGFLIGKTIDSFIIGVLCFILMNIFGLGDSYTIIISIFVGVTNMIPYFGPFLGAIPSFILILLAISPKEAFFFALLILALQQFDGNILGPYILGDSTGLRPIWIIFAISICGWAWGVLGMFLGVPLCSFVASVAEDFISSQLKKRNLDIQPYSHPPKDFSLSKLILPKKSEVQTPDNSEEK